jgi:1-pyrroline-5-carboxylate dehydrogenase
LLRYLIRANIQRSYPPGSKDRVGLEAALKKVAAAAPYDIPAIVNGKEVSVR